MNPEKVKKVQRVVENFIAWLEKFGEISYDHQSFFAGKVGGGAKALYYRRPLIGTLAVAPIIFCEAFIPSARRLFWKAQRLPIADAHYAMGFAFLSKGREDDYHRKSVHFLNALEESRCPDYPDYCWGYPFDWVTRSGTITANTPLITTTPYAYEAFLQALHCDGQPKWRAILDSIVRHVLTDIKEFPISETASTSSYTPFDTGGVVNAAAYRAFLLTSASVELGHPKALESAERNINFVLGAQQQNGSWLYAMDGERDFVDHFHTCFVMKALAKIEQLTGHNGCREAIDRGVEYYLNNLFDESGLPKPFSKAPRLTVYRHELYDYAECINLCLLLKNRLPEMNQVLERVVDDLLSRWMKSDGSFRSRELFLGWDNVPMHRWAQSQMFRSLSFLLRQG